VTQLNSTKLNSTDPVEQLLLLVSRTTSNASISSRVNQTSSENQLQSTNHSRVPMTKLMPTSKNDVEAASENTRVKSSANQDGIII